MYENLHDIGNTGVVNHRKIVAILRILQVYWRHALKYLSALWNSHVRNGEITCRVLCMLCPVWCHIGGQKHLYTPAVSVEVHCKITSFCCSLNCSGCFFLNVRLNWPTVYVLLTLVTARKHGLAQLEIYCFFCESLTRLFNRISVDKPVCNFILMRVIIIIFTVRIRVCVCVCVCVRGISSKTSIVE
jgi:hypothetical protein